ncbi:MAG: ribosome maturation factor [Bacteroidetes bacterium]|nr:ribosome maturation factor [Bacteroidota bacterium]MBS1741282.1 ribosome maturation factor [Bacteroidota bacterium]
MLEVLQKVQSLLLPLLEETDMFLVNINVKPTNNVKVFLDADAGLSIDKSAKINRKLYALIEESGMFPDGDFSLEVSSPGVDEPLQSIRQYQKNIGRTVAVSFLKEEKELIGILTTVSETAIVLSVKASKKKESESVEIPFSDIKQTIVQIVF